MSLTMKITPLTKRCLHLLASPITGHELNRLERHEDLIQNSTNATVVPSNPTSTAPEDIEEDEINEESENESEEDEESQEDENEEDEGDKSNDEEEPPQEASCENDKTTTAPVSEEVPEEQEGMPPTHTHRLRN